MRSGAGGVGCGACRVGRVRRVKWARACEKEVLLQDWEEETWFSRVELWSVSHFRYPIHLSTHARFALWLAICKHVVKDRGWQNRVLSTSCFIVFYN